jgi:orotate phosphoribosyltransferase
VNKPREDILKIFRSTGALLEGHFQLTSGLHSPQYFQCAKVLQYPLYAELFCKEIVDHFRSKKLDAVIAPALGGIVVGQEVGRLIAPFNQQIRTMFTERNDGTMQLRRGFEISPDESILVCEDVITTGGSVGEVIKIVRDAGARVAGVASIVDRSGGKVKFENQFSVLHMDVVTYQPAECPLCLRGIPVQKLGSRNP